MIDGWRTCPTGGLALVRKKGRGQQVCKCQHCGCSCTHRSGTPGSGYRFPAADGALEVRYDLRYRLRCGDLVEGLAERGVHVDRPMRYNWVQPFSPLDQDATRPQRQRVGPVWWVDKTHVRVGKHWPYANRAIDEHGQVLDGGVSSHRPAEDAKVFYRRWITSTGVRPRRVTRATAAYDPPA